ncbi:hypothetical protein MMC22_008450 [Lobaria immixta]|nr:hypothetical protein [Lobaria immixta]
MSVFASIPHELHRKRRAALNNFFSKASVRQIEPTVRDIVAQLLDRMDICGRSGEILPLNMIFKAVTSDIITSQIEEIKMSQDSKAGQDTVFYGLVHSNLPESEKTSSRLSQEAELIITAGQDTTAPTLSTIVYQLLANPDKLNKLKKELADAIPDSTTPPTCQQVDQLPYLSAVIQEVLRLHPSAPFRSQRVSPDEPLHYDDGSNPTWIIPAGTPMSMSIPLLQTDPNIFPEPNEFRPERWLDNPRLDRYLLTFSKGTRICLGINLAYQELYLITAAVFRKYDLYDGTGMQQGPTLALYDTTRERDVDMMSDLAIAYPARGSKGVRVLVRS